MHENMSKNFKNVMESRIKIKISSYQTFKHICIYIVFIFFPWYRFIFKFRHKIFKMLFENHLEHQTCHIFLTIIFIFPSFFDIFGNQ